MGQRHKCHSSATKHATMPSPRLSLRQTLLNLIALRVLSHVPQVRCVRALLLSLWAVTGACPRALTAPSPRFILLLSQLPGVVAPETTDEAGAFLDMLEDLVATTNDLVEKALSLQASARTYSAAGGGPPATPPSSQQRAAEKRALKRVSDARDLAWRRVHLAERHIIDKAVAISTASVFLAFAEEQGWSEEFYVEKLQGLMQFVYDMKDIMQEHFPEGSETAVYSLSMGGARENKRGRGAPAFEIDPVDIAWISEAPHGEGYKRRIRIQEVYGCGVSVLDVAVRLYREEEARAQFFIDHEDTGQGVDAGEFVFRRVHRDWEGNVLKELSEDEVAERVAFCRQSNLNLGSFSMVRLLRDTYKDEYFSHYRVAKILRTRDLSRRVRYDRVIPRTTLFTPFCLFSAHLDANLKAVKCGVTVTGLVCGSGAVIHIVPCIANRGELVAVEVVKSMVRLGGCVPRLLRSDKGGENQSALRIIDRFEGSNTYMGTSVHNQRIEALWSHYSRNVSGELMEKVYEFERQGHLKLDELIDFVIIQCVAYQYLVAKTEFFIQHRDRVVMPGDSLTKEQQFMNGIAEARAQGHLKVASPALWKQVFQEEMQYSKSQGNQVYGSAARLWSAAATSMQQQQRWAWLRPSHINQLHEHVGPFTRPGPGKIADPYPLVLARFKKGQVFMRALYSTHSTEPLYF